jgi:hypothetical protein
MILRLAEGVLFFVTCGVIRIISENVYITLVVLSNVRAEARCLLKVVGFENVEGLARRLIK